jgi:DNA-binding response OmpR family regulator
VFELIKVLLVEDNKKISHNIMNYLKKDFKIEAVYNGEDAILCLKEQSYDIVILDLMLPGVDGLEVLSFISESGLHTGVIVLTAKENLKDKLKAFHLGANDYLTKPFFIEELRARIHVVLKSLGKIEGSHKLVLKDLVIETQKKQASIRGEGLELNERLYHLLEYFMLNKGILLFKEQIFERICGYNSDATTEIVEVYMSHLRKRLSPSGYDKYLVTKRGMGYILDENAGE